jgi:Fe2+ or Zn2+ uptake regulation protein
MQNYTDLTDRFNFNNEIYHSPKISAKDEFGNEGYLKENKETGESSFIRNKWAQFPEKHFKTITYLFKHKKLAAEIFMMFLEHSDKNNCLIVSYETMMDIFGKKRTTIYKTIKYLKEKKLITTLKSGSSNIYCLNSNVVWKQAQDNLKYAKFTANVLISEAEQESKLQSIKTKGQKEVIKK